MDHLCYFCLVFVMLSRLLIAVLRAPAGKGLTSWLSFVMFNCVCVTFQCCIIGQVWYLIVTIPVLYHFFTLMPYLPVNIFSVMSGHICLVDPVISNGYSVLHKYTTQ